MSPDRPRLEDEDPRREGLVPLDDTRTRLQQAVLAAKGEPTAAPARSTRRLVVGPLLLVGGAAIIVAVGIGSARVWSPGSVTGLAQTAQIHFEVRLAEASAAAGLDPVSLEGDGRVLYLHRQVLVTNSDVADATAVEIGDGFAVRVTFTPAGAERLRLATGAHLGKPLAVLLDGRLALAPTLRTPLSETAVISGDYTRDAAERIVAGIRHSR